MSNQDTIKVALLGCGYWGKNLARNLNDIGALAGVYDPNDTRKKTIAEENKVIGYSDYGSILKNDQVSAIVIATPTPTHYELAKQALEARKDVFIEKPLSDNSNEAWDLIQIAQKYGLKIGTGHTTIYHPAFQRLISLIREGELGKIKYVETRQYKTGRMKTTEDIVWDAMPHEISIIIALANEEPINAKLITHQLFPPHPADIATLHLSFKSGLKSTHSASWVNHTRERWTMVMGDKATAIFTDLPSEDKALVLITNQFHQTDNKVEITKGSSQPIAFTFYEPLRQEMNDFIAAVKYRKEPISNGLLGLRIVKIIENAKKEEMPND